MYRRRLRINTHKNFGKYSFTQATRLFFSLNPACTTAKVIAVRSIKTRRTSISSFHFLQLFLQSKHFIPESCGFHKVKIAGRFLHFFPDP